MATHPERLTLAMIGPWPPPVGGVATVCVQLCRVLKDMGHAVHLLDVASDTSARKEEPSVLAGYRPVEAGRVGEALRVLAALAGSGDTRRCGLLRRTLRDAWRLAWYRRRPRKLLATLLRVDRMASWMERAGVTAVIGHHAGVSSWEGLMVARHYLHCPMLVIVYVSEFTMEINGPLLPLALAVCNEARQVVFISNYTQACARAAGVRNPKQHVVALGCDASHFARADVEKVRAVRQRLGVAEDRPLILYVGWLIERKGPQVLMDALRMLPGDDWQALFVGPDGGAYERLRRAAEEGPLTGRVRVCTPVPFDELLAIYDSAAVFVFPTLSRDEGFGLVALEAMAHGLPVVASRAGAIPETVREGETGFLFEPGDSAELARRLRSVLDDPALRARMGVAGREWASRFTWEATTKQIVDRLRDA